MREKFATGLDLLIEEQPELLKGQRIGLVSHSAAVTGQLTDNIQALLESGVHLTALFGPEHGFSAAVRDGIQIEDSRDSRTGLARW